jgi:hypothetical protein
MFRDLILFGSGQVGHHVEAVVFFFGDRSIFGSKRENLCGDGGNIGTRRDIGLRWLFILGFCRSKWIDITGTFSKDIPE